MAAAYALAALVSAVLLMAAYGYVRARNWKLAAVPIGTMLAAWAGLALALGWTPLAGDPDPRVSLRSSQWDCAKSHEREDVAIIGTGKSFVPVPVKTKVCDRYDRRR